MPHVAGSDDLRWRAVAVELRTLFRRRSVRRLLADVDVFRADRALIDLVPQRLAYELAVAHVLDRLGHGGRQDLRRVAALVFLEELGDQPEMTELIVEEA